MAAGAVGRHVEGPPVVDRAFRQAAVLMDPGEHVAVEAGAFFPTEGMGVLGEDQAALGDLRVRARVWWFTGGQHEQREYSHRAPAAWQEVQ